MIISMHDSTQSADSFFAAVGGEETFNTVVHRFYQQVREDDLIGPMYPVDDWEGAENRLRWFLIQYWGGPTTFSDNRGHPRLRMRHAPFRIGEAEAQRWLELMDNAIDEVDETTLPLPYRQAMRQHMQKVAYMLINAPGASGETN